MDRFNLNLFFALDAILNATTLTEAARTTHLTQPAMSVSLKKLRGYFQDELVVYEGGETRLTALAVALRPRIRQILQASREAMALSPDFDPLRDEGSVILTMPGVVEVMLLRRLAAIVCEEAPLTQIVSIPFRHEPGDRMFRNALDVAVMAESFAMPGFAQTRLFSDTMCCLVWNDSRYGTTITEAEFFAARHVGVSPVVEDTPHPTTTALRVLSERQNIAVRASSYAALPHVVIGTDLIATTLTGYARMCERMLPVRIVSSPIDMPQMHFVAQWQRYREPEGILKWIVEKLKQASAGLGSQA